MPERPDLRLIAKSIRDALTDFDRDALADVLTYVFKEYVVEGIPPRVLGRGETIEDLGELNFAELIQTLQTRLDVPELALFQVQGDNVLVRAGGVLTPLLASDAPRRDAPPEPPPVSAPAPAHAGSPTSSGDRPRASVEEARDRGRGDLAGLPRENIRPPAPRPRGISVNGRAAGGSGAAAPQPGAAASSPAAAPAGTPAQAADAHKQDEPEKPTPDEDTASVRFSLLELD